MDKQVINLQGIKAALFDLNGTIIDDMIFHRKAWIEFSKRHGVDLTEQEFLSKYSGKNNKEILPSLLNKDLTSEEIMRLADEKEKIYREIYTPYIKEITGLTDLLKKLKEKNIKLAVATTAIKDNRDFALKAIGLKQYFDLIMGDEHASRGKPDPEIYLNSASSLHVNPDSCLVFEDTPFGVEAGKAAGMKVIAILTTHSEGELSLADLKVKDFSQIDI